MSGRNTSDKFLWAIVAGILLLVVIAFIVIARRPSPAYLPDDSPQGIVHNYLLALQLGDYERAYSYLSPEILYPADVNEFFDSLGERPWDFPLDDNVSLAVERSDALGQDSASVTVRQTYGEDSIFGGSGYTESFRMRVQESDAGWKLVSGERFWSTCWGDRDKCSDAERREP